MNDEIINQVRINLGDIEIGLSEAGLITHKIYLAIEALTKLVEEKR